MTLLQIFKSLQQKQFAKLYAAQTISLLGDALTWVGVALLAFEFAGKDAASVLSVALTIRVTAFILFGPYAGLLADKINRRIILLIADIGRMILVLLLTFVTTEGQLYVVIFFLNIFSAFFTPAFKASIPQMIKDKEKFAPAITLSNATYQLLAIMGPGLAGAAAALMGAREIFFADAASFLLSCLFVLSISRIFFRLPGRQADAVHKNTWSEVFEGTRILFRDHVIRFALLIELTAAIVGASILVNTVGYVKGVLDYGDKQYGWVMSALGVGAVIGAFGSAMIDKSPSRKGSLIAGALILSLSVIAANNVSLYVLLPLWVLAGLGQNLAEMPSQLLIAERIPEQQQGRVYGAHFAWSHLWWAIGYPVAGLTGRYLPGYSFLAAGCLSLAMLIIILIIQSLKKNNL